LCYEYTYFYFFPSRHNNITISRHGLSVTGRQNMTDSKKSSPSALMLCLIKIRFGRSVIYTVACCFLRALLLPKKCSRVE